MKAPLASAAVTPVMRSRRPAGVRGGERPRFGSAVLLSGGRASPSSRSFRRWRALGWCWPTDRTATEHGPARAARSVVVPVGQEGSSPGGCAPPQAAP